jgi:hypothetical protein
MITFAEGSTFVTTLTTRQSPRQGQVVVDKSLWIFQESRYFAHNNRDRYFDKYVISYLSPSYLKNSGRQHGCITGVQLSTADNDESETEWEAEGTVDELL